MKDEEILAIVAGEVIYCDRKWFIRCPSGEWCCRTRELAKLHLMHLGLGPGQADRAFRLLKTETNLYGPLELK